MLPGFPFGTDLTDDEIHRGGAAAFEEEPAPPGGAGQHRAAQRLEGREAPPAYLARLGLDEAKGFKGLVLKKLFAGNL